jgi:predicted DNA-binding transcriptional regulator AlpA
MRRDWVALLARRWDVCEETVRYYVKLGHFGAAQRVGHNAITVSSHAVLKFETRYADVLGIGAPVMGISQICKRYGIAQRTFFTWKKQFQFPSALKLPGSNKRKWRVSDIEQWDHYWRISPQTTIVVSKPKFASQ